MTGTLKTLAASLIVVVVVLAAVALVTLNARDQGDRISQLQQRVDSLGARYRAETNLVVAAQNEAGRWKSEAQNPTLQLWTTTGAVGPGGTVYGAPDTFDVYLRFTATVPVTVYVLAPWQYADWYNWRALGCRSAVACIRGAYQVYGPSTAIDEVFTLSEGCAGYLFLVVSDTPGTITGDTWAKYNPSGHPTGICRQ